jgi:hypothetical protein
MIDSTLVWCAGANAIAIARRMEGVREIKSAGVLASESAEGGKELCSFSVLLIWARVGFESEERAERREGRRVEGMWWVAKPRSLCIVGGCD